MDLIKRKFIDLSKISNLDKLISNKWTGQAFPENLDITVKLDCQFEVRDNMIYGKMDVDDEGEILRIDLEGGCVNYPFLVFDYFSSDPDIINYGRIMYKINETCDRLEGRVVGYSGERDFFVNARHDLKVK